MDNEYGTDFAIKNKCRLDLDMVREANEFDSAERKARMAAEAGADIARSYEDALKSSQRAMERMGVNPNSGKFQGLARIFHTGVRNEVGGAM